MQHIREHYERQDTEELLEIARKDLTEEARAVLHEVLAKRAIPLEEVQAVRHTEMTEEEARVHAETRLASRWLRLVAFAIDFWGVGLVVFGVLVLIRLVSLDLLSIPVDILWLAYLLLRDSIPGQSLGKRLLGIRVEQVDTGLSCTWSKSFWRNLSHVLFVLDALFALGQRRMRLGDMIAGTVVVRSLPAQVQAGA